MRLRQERWLGAGKREIQKPLPEGYKVPCGEVLPTHLTFYSFPELDAKKVSSTNRPERLRQGD